ncbi:hypothetical protein N7V53_09020 [Kosakonia sp. HypNH10]|uniref:hypothetical protein n=1 Tax=Kosakonia sp. HypNH10 TaxID=2980101 RepID=UPI00244C0908|nr:hypothetical protein [Kosakonia sp. HypNH10]MDH2912669.1 hypothetical protein [Kosakonia sp. HypNH10]
MMKLLSPAQKSSLEARFQTFGEKQQREKKLRSRAKNNCAAQKLSIKNPAEAGFEVTC